MIINFRKIRKILGRIWTAPKRIFETFCTQEAPRCIIMNATHKTIYLISENNKGFSLYYVPCKKNCYLIILSIHILKLEILGCDNWATNHGATMACQSFL
jgi:hypothetical protein